MPKRKESNQSENTTSHYFSSHGKEVAIIEVQEGSITGQKWEKIALNYTKATPTLKSTLIVPVSEWERKS